MVSIYAMLQVGLIEELGIIKKIDMQKKVGYFAMSVPRPYNPSLMDRILPIVLPILMIAFMIGVMIVVPWSIVSLTGYLGITSTTGLVLASALGTGIASVFIGFAGHSLGGKDYTFKQAIADFTIGAIIGGFLGWFSKMRALKAASVKEIETASPGILNILKDTLSSNPFTRLKATDLLVKLKAIPKISTLKNIGAALNIRAYNFFDFMGNLFMRQLMFNYFMNIHNTNRTLDVFSTFGSALIFGAGSKTILGLFLAFATIELSYEHLGLFNDVISLPTCQGEAGLTLGYQFACRDGVGGVRVEFFDFLRYAAIAARGNPLARSLFIPEILGVSALAADFDYIAVRYVVSKAGEFYDIAEHVGLSYLRGIGLTNAQGKFVHGYDYYLEHEQGLGISLDFLTTYPTPSVYPLDWREPWMYDQDYRSEWAITRDYDSVTALLVEYGLMDI